MSIFSGDGQQDLARRIQKPVHVIPHLDNLGLPNEDSFSLHRQQLDLQYSGSGPRTACVLLFAVHCDDG